MQCFPTLQRTLTKVGVGDEMGIQHHSIHGSQALDLASLPATDVHVAMGCGRGARLLVPLGWISVTLVLSGVLELNSGDAPWQIFSHHLQVWLDGGLRHTNRAPAWWLCIAAPASVWDQIPRSPPVTNLLIPHEVRCDRELASTILHIARRCNFRNTANNAAIQDGMMVLRDTLIERQQTMRDYLERCSGRTAQRRHQTMLRLLRVQHLIRCNVDARLDLNHLAAVANYSPPHLIRVYRDVFDETPFEFASRLRLQRAWNMACTTRLSICEIADALGFETESAFCRAFKQTFGCTASQARRQNLDSKAASSPTSKGSTTADGQLLIVAC